MNGDNRKNTLKVGEAKMNAFSVIYDMFEPFLDGEKKPLNLMEASNLWLFHAITDNTMRNEEIAYNIARDPDLKNLLKEVKEKIHQPIGFEISQILRAEGVSLPDTTPAKPIGDYKDIHEGAKLTDEEIANMMSFNLLLGINYASRGLTESIRADVGLVFFKIIVKKVTFGLSVKRLMEERGWLRMPPSFKV